VLRAFGALIDEIVASQITALEWTSGDLLEVSGMLEQRIEIWKQEARQAGLLEGRTEGREEGRVEGELSGLEKGKAEGKAELEAAVRKIALNLKNQGLSSEKVSELTGLFIEDIDKLT
jgi:predicted transposase YdaD